MPALKKHRRVLVALALATGLTTGLAAPATADGGAPERIEAPPLYGVEVVDDHNELEGSESVLALYNGNIISLANGWGDASTCAVYSDMDVRCYTTEADFLLDSGNGDTASGSLSTDGSCSAGWGCIWEHINYTGRRLQFRDAGPQQKLSAYGFRDTASSAWNRMQAGKYLDLVDFRTWDWDPYIVFSWSHAHSNFTQIKYNGGSGTWNDRADAVRIRHN